jgi:hypothetical protein
VRIAQVTALLVGLVVAGVALAPRAAAELEPGVAYVSGLQMGKGKKALLRVSNVSPAHVSYELVYTVFAEDGNVLAVFSGVPLPLDRTVELDVGKAVNARRAQINPEASSFTGPIQLIVQGTGGFGLNPFGRHTVALEAVQKRRSSTFEAAVQWR